MPCGAPAVARLREKVAQDPDGDAGRPNYGSSFREEDYAPIPRRDLPFGVPDFLGDDSAGRQAHPRHNDAVPYQLVGIRPAQHQSPDGRAGRRGVPGQGRPRMTLGGPG